MNVLVACEYSGVVRNAFANRGHYVMSCDLLDTEQGCIGDSHHYKGDIKDLIDDNRLIWDLMIAFPPCTHLAVSGARWFKYKLKEQQEALDFVSYLMDCRISKICIENPISIISSRIRKPDQIIQPWQFGHPEQKTTCLWLKNLPKLIPNANSSAVYDQMMKLPKHKRERVHYLMPGKNRWKERSRTFVGIGQAMAEQWG